METKAERIIAEKTAEILLEISAVQVRSKEPFLYASGMRGPIYCDNRLLLSFPGKWKQVIDFILETIKVGGIRFDIIVGVATSGIPHASVLSQKLQKPMVYVRTKEKDHGKKNRIEGKADKGMKALVIEDLVNTGGSTIEVVEALRESGVNVTDCICIFSYSHEMASQLFKNSNTNLVSLTNLDILLHVAEKKGKITSQEKEMVLEWRKNPKEWSGKIHDNLKIS